MGLNIKQGGAAVYGPMPGTISGGKGDAGSKTAAMESAGITVSPSPARLGKTLADLLRK
jgi:succinyl-CoA synthetase alpha subunit